MKKIRRIPTILVILILLLCIIGGVFWIKKGAVWFIRADPEITPKQVKIANISESSFSVSWITDKQTRGFLIYGENKDALSLTALDDREQFAGESKSFFTHHVTVKNLKPLTTYFFKINSQGKSFDNDGQPYQISTGPLLPDFPSSDVAYGTVVDKNNSSIEGAIVYFSLRNAALMSTLTKSSGVWAIPLNLARTVDLSSYVSYDRERSLIEVFIQGGAAGSAMVIATTKDDSPLPPIVLGQNYDFRQDEITPTPFLPSSKFSFTEIKPPVTRLNIINPAGDEEISTLRPEFFGTGPPGEKLEIIINSSKAITTTLTINEEGNWRWSPPSDLSPGKHTITIRLPNGEKITRSFIVLASDFPAFIASPSAILTPTMTATLTPTLIFTPTPSPLPTLSIPPRISRPSTDSGIPHPGVLTPTFLLFIMGINLVSLGIIGGILFK